MPSLSCLAARVLDSFLKNDLISVLGRPRLSSNRSVITSLSKYCYPKSNWTIAVLIIISPNSISFLFIPKGEPPQTSTTIPSLIPVKLERRLDIAFTELILPIPGRKARTILYSPSLPVE